MAGGNVEKQEIARTKAITKFRKEKLESCAKYQQQLKETQAQAEIEEQETFAAAMEEARNAAIASTQQKRDSLAAMDKRRRMSCEAISLSLDETKLMLRKVEQKQEQQMLQMTLASDGISTCKSIIAEQVVKRMNEINAQIAKRKKFEELQMGKWQRLWRLSCRRILAMLRVDAYKAMLQKMGFEGQYLGEKRPATKDLMHAPIGSTSDSADDDCLSLLSLEVTSTKIQPGMVKTQQAASLTTPRTALEEAGRNMIMSSSTPIKIG